MTAPLPADGFVDLRSVLPTDGQYYTRTEATIKRIIVHHTATVQTTWENVARYHVEHNGWPGIGYHYGITPDGTISYLGDIRTIRYHAGTANADSIGVCFMGNFMTDKPTSAALGSFARLQVALEQQLGRKLTVQGHRDVGQTQCPGDNLYRVLFGPNLDVVEGALYAAVEAHDVLSVNPQAALAKEGRKRDLWPTTNEVEAEVDGITYVAQRYRDPDSDAVWVLYCVKGEWGNVRAFRY